MRELANRITKSHTFEFFIIGLIVLNGAIWGVETFPHFAGPLSHWLDLGHHLILGVFIIEAALKMFALAPRPDRYFRSGWNIFDFLVIVASLIPASGGFAAVARLARLARLMRVLRLISAVPELRLIVATLVRSIPSMLNIVALMSLVVYIYAIIGYQLFNAHDPDRWGNLGAALLTLFQIVTLEDWVSIMDTATELYPLAWLYFVSFVILGTFIVINLFIAVVINNLDEAKQERLAQLEQPHYRDGLLDEIRATQQSLQRLEEQLRLRSQDGSLSTSERVDAGD